MEQKINPTKILVSPIADEPQKTASGIIIPTTITQKKTSLKGLILLTGKGTVDIEMIHKAGETVLINPYSGTFFEWQGKEVKLIDQADVLLNLGVL